MCMGLGLWVGVGMNSGSRQLTVIINSEFKKTKLLFIIIEGVGGCSRLLMIDACLLFVCYCLCDSALHFEL